jgi:hypothetical protein
MEVEEATMTQTFLLSPAQRESGRRRRGNAVYGLGLIGALVFFWQQADSFGEYLLAILKALVGLFWCTRCSRASSFEAAVGRRAVTQAAAMEGAASPVSALNCSGRHIELDALLDEPTLPVLELAGVKVPDGMPAGRQPPTPVIRPAIDRRGPRSPGHPTRESCPTIGGAEVDHAALLVDEDP